MPRDEVLLPDEALEARVLSELEGARHPHNQHRLNLLGMCDSGAHEAILSSAARRARAPRPQVLWTRWTPKTKRRRTQISRAQSARLDEMFARNAFPSKAERETVARGSAWSATCRYGTRTSGSVAAGSRPSVTSSCLRLLTRTSTRSPPSTKCVERAEHLVACFGVGSALRLQLVEGDEAARGDHSRVLSYMTVEGAAALAKQDIWDLTAGLLPAAALIF